MYYECYHPPADHQLDRRRKRRGLRRISQMLKLRYTLHHELMRENTIAIHKPQTKYNITKATTEAASELQDFMIQRKSQTNINT